MESETSMQAYVNPSPVIYFVKYTHRLIDQMFYWSKNLSNSQTTIQVVPVKENPENGIIHLFKKSFSG